MHRGRGKRPFLFSDGFTEPGPLQQAMNPNELLGGVDALSASRTMGVSPEGSLPITAEQLRSEPSGNLFGLTQNAGMGMDPKDIARDQYLILSTQGGLRDTDGTPIALGYHTGHWEIGLMVRAAAETLRAEGMLPFSATVSDPCDGRSQGTLGMFDSLPYRNDAAITMRRLIRQLPLRYGVLGIATCDKGLPAMMLALAGCGNLPGIIVPGGVTLPTPDAEDTGKVQTIGARFAQGMISLEHAAAMGCRACGSPGGGCQFLGTAATAQVIAESLGMALPHTALAPSGEPVWMESATRSASALVQLVKNKTPMRDIVTQEAVENAMLLHAAFGGSTNLLLHLPAIAHAAGLRVPGVEDWIRINRKTTRLVDALPNGPENWTTTSVFYAGGVPEVMLHLREHLHLDVMTASGVPLGDVIDAWEGSERRATSREKLAARGIDPDRVILGPQRARAAGLSSTTVFPTGNLAPEGSVVKATAIDPAVIDDDNVYRFRGPARVFGSEATAIEAIKASVVQAGDCLVLAGCGPTGTGMEETYQLTSALKYIPWGKTVPIVTDARFSGVSTGACIGHVGPEALAGGPLGKLRDGDEIEIIVDRNKLEGSINYVGDDDLGSRSLNERIAPHPDLPDDTKIWALLQAASGGTWGGCVYDVDALSKRLLQR